MSTAAPRRIGILVSDLDAFFVTEVVRAVRRRLAEAEVPLHLVFTAPKTTDPAVLAAQLKATPADGWILLVFEEAMAARSCMRASSLPHVWINHFPEDAAYTVASDDRRGMGRLLDHLARDIGVRRLVFVENRMQSQAPVPTRVRREAFDEYLRVHHDLEGTILTKESADPWSARLSSAAQQELKKSSTYTVFVCYNDYTAAELMAGMHQLGLEAPQDYGITGFADWPSTQFLKPPLTTVRQFPERLGQEAASLLLAQLEGRELHAMKRHVRTEVLLVTRESVRLQRVVK